MGKNRANQQRDLQQGHERRSTQSTACFSRTAAALDLGRTGTEAEVGGWEKEQGPGGIEFAVVVRQAT